MAAREAFPGILSIPPKYSPWFCLTFCLTVDRNDIYGSEPWPLCIAENRITSVQHAFSRRFHDCYTHTLGYHHLTDCGPTGHVYEHYLLQIIRRLQNGFLYAETMSMTPSIGDILMLSQTAWRIGRAFTHGKKSAPAEFAEVEREADGLSDALRLVAETLNTDASILHQAEITTQSAVTTILGSAQRTLSDLESFVARYRIIKPHSGERSWSEVVLANYKTIKWTTEGGDISALRDMLHMHTSTITLTMQALQSQSLARLEKVVMPMAENVVSIHDRAYKIDDVHRFIMAIVNGLPSLAGQSAHERLNSTASQGTSSIYGTASNGPRLIDTSTAGGVFHALDCPSIQHISHSSSACITNGSAECRTVNAICYESDSSAQANGHVTNVIDWNFESGAPPSDETSIGDGSIAMTPDSSASANGPLQHPYTDETRRDSTTLPLFFTKAIEDDAQEGSSWEVSSTPSPVIHGSMRRTDSKAIDYQFSPPALSPKERNQDDRQPFIPTAHSVSSTQASKHSSFADPANAGSERTCPRTPSSTLAFERTLFRNAAILCEVRSTLVEFAQHNPDEEDPRFDTEMISVCRAARIFVIRKRESCDNGGTRVVASIWAISDDGEVRCQQKLPEYTETVPYCSFFESEKVAVSPANDEIVLRLHAQRWGDREQKDIRTKWVNYIFEFEDHANQFQSAVFGRQLLGSFRTTKTTVLHEGFKGTFAFEEQFANIEVLRLWKDDGVSTTGAAGGVIALLHMSGNFGQGYAKWWMNSSRQQVRVKDEHSRFAKLKGVDVRVLQPVEMKSGANSRRSSSALSDRSSSKIPDTKRKRGSERYVTGFRIEFKTEDEQTRFVNTAKRVQERLLPLPDI